MESEETDADQAEARLVGRGSPFELVSERADDGPDRLQFRHGPKSLIDIWARAARATNHVILDNGAATLTNGELFRKAGVLASNLQSRFGARCDTRIALVLQNTPEWMVSFVAVTMAGATVAVIHAALDPVSIASCIADAQCSVVFLEYGIAESLRDLGVTTPMLVVGRLAAAVQVRGYTRDLTEFLALDCTAPAASNMPSVAPRSEALVAFTSGSTGRPKGVVISHRSIVTGMMNSMLAAALSALRRTKRDQSEKGAAPASIVIAPFSHVAGYMSFVSMLHVGGRLITKPALGFAAVEEIITRQRVSALVGAPPEIVQALLTRLGTSEALRSLRAIGLNGVQVTGSLLAEVAAGLPHASIGTGYGLTETSGLVSAGSTLDSDYSPLSCGHPLPSTGIRIVTADGGTAAAGELGEIWVSGSMLADRYLQSQLNPPPFQGGWFKTADAGKLDARGRLFAFGRMSQRISYNGRTLHCTVLEHMVLEDAQVREAAVIDLSSTFRQQRIAVAVVPRPGHPVSAASIRHRLSATIKEDDLVVLELQSLPRAATGKVDRVELRALAFRLERGAHSISI